MVKVRHISSQYIRGYTINKFQLFGKSYFWIPFLIIACPTFPSIIGFGNQLVYIISIFILLVANLFGNFKIKFSKGMILYGAYFVGITILDVVLETARNSVSPNDYLEVVRPVGFLLCYCYYRYSAVPIALIEKYVIRFFYWTFSIIGIYCLLEYVFPSQVRDISFLLWKRKEVGILSNKAVGTFFQTYNCAYAFLIPYFIGFISLFKRFKLSNLLFFVLMFCTMLLTQSKSMYLCMGLGTVICVWCTTDFKSVKSLMRSVIIIAFFILVLGTLFVIYKEDITISLSYAISGFEAISEGNNGSLNTRQAQIEWALENNIFGFIGFGIGKSQILLESIYALYYYRYGLIGITLLLILILYAASLAYKIIKQSHGSRKILYESLFVFFIINPLALSSSCHQDMPKTSLLFYGMLGLIFARNAYNKTKLSI